MSETPQAKSSDSGCGCGCGCFGCLGGCLGGALLSVLVSVGLVFLAPAILVSGLGMLTGGVQQQLAQQGASPLELPAYDPDPQLRQQALNQLAGVRRDSQGASPRLQLSEAQANALLRGLVRDPERIGLLKAVEDVHLELGEGTARARVVASGPALSQALSAIGKGPADPVDGAEPALPVVGEATQLLGSIFGSARYLNVDATLEARGAGLALTRCSVAGMQLPTVVSDQLSQLFLADLLRGKGTLRSLAFSPDQLEVEFAAPAAGGDVQAGPGDVEVPEPGL